jgi:hypothetical protein
VTKHKIAHDTKRSFRPWRCFMLLCGATILALFGESSAANALSCWPGEFVGLINPVVTVIDGPGDTAEEQATWEALSFSYLEGPLSMTLSEQTFRLEKTP